jgi:hypothetical protein
MNLTEGRTEVFTLPCVRRLIGLVVALPLLLAGAGTSAAAAEPGHRPAPANKYYVVGQPVGGQREFLFAIAQKTLGNGNRYPEIVELTRGRPQPDGEELVNAMEVRPGWVLVLPPDANGPGVYAEPPEGFVTASASPSSPASASPSRTLESPPASEPPPSRNDDNGMLLLGVIVGMLLVALGVALKLMRVARREPADPVGEPSVVRLERSGVRLPVPTGDGHHWTDSYGPDGVHHADRNDHDREVVRAGV